MARKRDPEPDESLDWAGIGSLGTIQGEQAVGIAQAAGGYSPIPVQAAQATTASDLRLKLIGGVVGGVAGYLAATPANLPPLPLAVAGALVGALLL